MEIEYEQIYDLLRKRHSRQLRDGKAHLLDNLKAKKGMRDMKEIGRVFAFMERGKREKDEEVLWWSFWKKGKQFKDIVSKKNPEIAAKMIKKEDLNSLYTCLMPSFGWLALPTFFLFFLFPFSFITDAKTMPLLLVFFTIPQS